MITRFVGGIDVRDFGSGKTGTTNVARTIGIRWGILALILDMGKAILSVTLARYVLDIPPVLHAISGLAVVIGHTWPITTGFKGGRGIAPGWGSLLVLSPLSGLVAALVGLPVIGAFRYLSLGSLLGAIVGCATLIGLCLANQIPLAYIIYGIVAGIMVTALHKDNIHRLLQGNERRLGERVDVKSSNERKLPEM